MKDTIWFRPKLFETVRGYSTQDFLADLTAGITVGIVALPLAMAFGILGAVGTNAIEVDDRDCVAVSYPGFWRDLARARRVRGR